MSTISLRLPESLHEQARELAAQEGISINQLIATSLAEKMAALMTGEYLAERAARGSRRKFERVLKKVRDRPPSNDSLEQTGRPTALPRPELRPGAPRLR